jgi:soluble lytic murein transglycosylase-like protein
MQIMPQTWEELRGRYGLGRDPFDPHDNILAGAAFLREMHDRHGSPWFLAVYNARPGRYEHYRDRNRSLPSETLAYVAELLPLLGDDDGVMPIPVPAPNPLAWTRAPIFIARSVGARAANQASSQAPSDSTPTVTAARDVSAIAPQSDGLFVAISAAEPKP